MAEFYEFHDSILNKVEWNQQRLVLHLSALRTVWPQSPGEGEASIFRQEIQIMIEDASMEVDSDNVPNWLLDGSFQAGSQEAEAEDTYYDLIPASLSRADNVQLRLEGMNEDTHEYIVMQICGKSMSIAPLGGAEFMRKFRP